MANIYVASSWRNEIQQNVVLFLRNMGHAVYDFKNPPHGKGGFAWSDIDENWQNWNTEEYKKALEHPIAEHGFASDFDGMKWADVCVLVLPCGRSANSEAGWMKGAGKHVIVYQPRKEEPELMYKLYDNIVSTLAQLDDAITMLPKQEQVLSIQKCSPSRIDIATRIVAGMFASGLLKNSNTNKEIVAAAYELADELIEQGFKK